MSRNVPEKPWPAGAAHPAVRAQGLRLLRSATELAQKYGQERLEHELLRALPPPLKDDDVIDVLSHQPSPRPRNFFALPLEVRLEFLSDLDEVFVATRIQREAFQIMSRAMREAMRWRKPSNPHVMAYLRAVLETQKEILLPRQSCSGGNARGILLEGLTGIGKTSLADRFVAHVGAQGILHESLGGLKALFTQLPIIRISAADTKTEAQLVSEIAQEADARLASNYHDELNKSRGRSAPSEIATRIISSNWVAMLIIEDIQLWYSESARTRADLLELLAKLMEKTGVQVVSIATCRVSQVIETHQATGSKLMSGGHPIMHPMPYGKDYIKLCTVFYALRLNKGPLEPPE
ncbi:hypothetical protein CBA19CS22_12535 [Caballeronia novacaledonica]|uniref:Uncharacterized protein n=2 Tax=Burkholderiaceae TaxID=119060 RepID=A0ACB5QR12_9BURK|nr:hypothetical protein CBA19CS22_12535 [Caballeronia novacaledonica]